jgi:hypothetical protein
MHDRTTTRPGSTMHAPHVGVQIRKLDELVCNQQSSHQNQRLGHHVCCCLLEERGDQQTVYYVRIPPVLSRFTNPIHTFKAVVHPTYVFLELESQQGMQCIMSSDVSAQNGHHARRCGYLSSHAIKNHIKHAHWVQLRDQSRWNTVKDK